MTAEDFQLNQVGGNDVARRQRMADVKLRHAGCDDAAFFRVSHHRVAEIFRRRIGRFDLTHDTENMLSLFGGAQIATQYRITALQLINISNPLNDLGQMRRRHHATGPFPVLRMVGELNGVKGPDVCAKAAHRKLCGTVAGVTKYNVGLDGEDVLHLGYLTAKNKGRGFPRPCLYAITSSRPDSNFSYRDAVRCSDQTDDRRH